MKKLLFCLLLTGCSDEFKVGGCVREMGKNAIETVIAVNSKGTIETQYKSTYGNLLKDVYTKQNQDKLINVNCVD